MLIGRVANTPQMKKIESFDSVLITFTLVTNRKYKNQEGNLIEDAEYHRCVAYWNAAEVLWKYLIKGKKIYTEWRLKTRKWQDTEWNDRFSTEIIVDNFIFLDSKSSSNSEEPSPIELDDELPF